MSEVEPASDSPVPLRAKTPAQHTYSVWAIILTILFMVFIGFVLLMIVLAFAGVQWLAVKFWWVLLFGGGFYWVYRKLKNPAS